MDATPSGIIGWQVMKTVWNSIVLNIFMAKLDCVWHKKRMGKHLLNLEARTKGNITDGQPIGSHGQLIEGKIKQLQKYDLAIPQNTIKRSNPTKREVDLAVYAVKKNIIATLHHGVTAEDPAKQQCFCPPGKSS